MGDDARTEQDILELLEAELAKDPNAGIALSVLVSRARDGAEVTRRLVGGCCAFLGSHGDPTRRGVRCVTDAKFIADRLRHDPPKPGCSLVAWLSVLHAVTIDPKDLIFAGSPYHDLFMSELRGVVRGILASHGWASSLRREEDEAVNEAYVAVVKAAERYHAGRAAGFFTFAYRYIWRALRDYALGKLPADERDLLKGVEEAKAALRRDEEPTPEAVADMVWRAAGSAAKRGHCKRYEALRAKVLRVMEGLANLDAEYGEGEGATIGGLLAEPTELSPVEVVMAEDDRRLSAVLWGILALHTNRPYAQLLALRLGEVPPVPHKEIARRLFGVPDHTRSVHEWQHLLADAEAHVRDIEQAYGPDRERFIRAMAVRCTGRPPPPSPMVEAIRRLLGAARSDDDEASSCCAVRLRPIGPWSPEVKKP
jgi:hypothetical protein